MSPNPFLMLLLVTEWFKDHFFNNCWTCWVFLVEFSVNKRNTCWNDPVTLLICHGYYFHWQSMESQRRNHFQSLMDKHIFFAWLIHSLHQSLHFFTAQHQIFNVQTRKICKKYPVFPQWAELVCVDAWNTWCCSFVYILHVQGFSTSFPTQYSSTSIEDTPCKVGVILRLIFVTGLKAGELL